MDRRTLRSAAGTSLAGAALLALLAACEGPGLEPPKPLSGGGRNPAVVGGTGTTGAYDGTNGSAGYNAPPNASQAGSSAVPPKPMEGESGAAGQPHGGSSAGAAGAAAPDGMSDEDCGASELGEGPFGCDFAWGSRDPDGSLDGYAQLQFVSKEVGRELRADGSFASCDGCAWLSSRVANTQLVPVFYADFIRSFGRANGLIGGDEYPNEPKLSTDGAALIRAQRSAIVEMYAWYARETYAVWQQPLLWQLSADLVLYTHERQSQPLSYEELAQLIGQILCAIKSNMPTAQVAIHHATGSEDQVTRAFWSALNEAHVGYDLVWTSGVANNDGFFEASASARSENSATATYAAVAALSGRKILVDASFGSPELAASWTSASTATLNARIADGVIAASVTPALSARALIRAEPQLDPTCD